MLLLIGNRLVNLDHVQHIEPLPPEPPHFTFPEVRVTFTDGDTYDGGSDLPGLLDFRGLSGTIVPAPPGLVMVEMVPVFDVNAAAGAAYVSSPILAFRVGGEPRPVPIAVKGEPWYSNAFAVVYPDGTARATGDLSPASRRGRRCSSRSPRRPSQRPRTAPNPGPIRRPSRSGTEAARSPHRSPVDGQTACRCHTKTHRPRGPSAGPTTPRRGPVAREHRSGPPPPIAGPPRPPGGACGL